MVEAELVLQLQLLPQARVPAGHDLVEDVVAALARRLPDHPRLLEEVVLDVAAGNLAGFGEVDPDELAEPGKGGERGELMGLRRCVDVGFE